MIFIVGCPASLRDFVTGGDYLINALYVVIAMDLVFVAMDDERRWCRYAAAIFLSVAVSSRPNYLIAVPVLAGTVFQSRGWGRMVEFLVLVGLGYVVLNGPLYYHGLSQLPILQCWRIDVGYPSSFHAPLVLPAVGALIGFCSFFGENGPSACVRSDGTFPSTVVLYRARV